jgi:hypothetical protein
MDLANMRRQGVRNLIAHCLNDACRLQAVIDVSSYPGLMVPVEGEVRRAPYQDRRQAELERCI